MTGSSETFGCAAACSADSAATTTAKSTSPASSATMAFGVVSSVRLTAADELTDSSYIADTSANHVDTSRVMLPDTTTLCTPHGTSDSTSDRASRSSGGGGMAGGCGEW